MIGADTSFLLATRVSRDTIHKAALDFYGDHQEEISGSGAPAIGPQGRETCVTRLVFGC